MKQTISDSFIPALKELNSAKPLEFFEKLLKLQCILTNADATELVAIWHTLETAIKLETFSDDEMTTIKEMQEAIKAKALFIRGSSPEGPVYRGYRDMFYHIIGH